MRPEPLVSIVTTCYRHEPYLDDYFRSLLSQTYSNVELIFIDDGSPDGSWEKAKSYEHDIRSKFSRVMMLNQRNAGMHATLQRALAQATGEYVSILESDDFLLPEKIETNVSHFFDHPDDGFVYSDLHVLYCGRIVHNLHSYRSRTMPNGMIFDDLLERNYLHTCTSCFRAEALHKYGRVADYEKRGYLMVDYPLWLDLARHVRFGYIPQALAYYRILDESASHSRHDDHRQATFVLSSQRVRLEYMSLSQTTAIAPQLYNDLLYFAFWCREAHLYRESISSYLLAMTTFPFSLHTYTWALKLLPHYILAMMGIRKRDRSEFEKIWHSQFNFFLQASVNSDKSS